MNWPWNRRSNPARDLAMLGVEKRQWRVMHEHERVKAVARAMRQAQGLPEDPRLA